MTYASLRDEYVKTMMTFKNDDVSVWDD